MGKSTNPIEEGKVQNLQIMLEQLNSSLLYIHKLQLRTRIKKEHYDELNITSTKGKDNEIKYHLERINQAQGKQDVEYNIFSNGTITIYVSCSDNPFRLYNEEDISKIITYLGRVEDRLKALFSDTTNAIVPSSLEWVLVGCDVNKDIQIEPMAQLTSINLQINPAIRGFRSYVKRIEDQAFYRFEIPISPNKPVSSVFESLRKDVKIDKDSLSL